MSQSGSMEQAGREFDELQMISNVDERIKTACQLFSEGKVHAKAIRMLFRYLNYKQKTSFLNQIYAPEVREENFKRLSVSQLEETKAITVSNEKDAAYYENLLKYYLLEVYQHSKGKAPSKRIKDLTNCVQNRTYPFFAAFPGRIIGVSQSNILQEVIQEITREMRESQETDSLGLPGNITIGVELEGVGLNKMELLEILQIEGMNPNGFLRVKTDSSVHEKNGKAGCEVVTSPFSDTKEDWKLLQETCNLLKLLGFRANKTCGGHIHIGINVLGVDKEAWQTFLNMWKEVEPILYMISNRKGETTRSGGVRYAGMTTPFIEHFPWEQVTIRDEADLATAIKRGMQNNRSYYNREYYDRYHSLNLCNIGTKGKNTIEFRLPNGIIDYSIVRENIMLFGRMLHFAKIHSVMPTWKSQEYEALFEKDIPEKEKLKRFLDVIFEKEGEKQIFIDRWASRAGEKPLFGERSITTYQRQKEKEPSNKPKKRNIDTTPKENGQDMVSQIGDIASNVPEEDRVNAMNVLIGQEQRISQESAPGEE